MRAEIADVCIVGVGAVGGILAKELGSAGLKVVTCGLVPTGFTRPSIKASH